MNKTSSHAKDVTGFFLILTLVFGIAVRILPLLRVDFPLVDGGMFYSMIKDLQTANFSLPMFTTYNNAQIPFAYPPLAFYLAGILNAATNISILNILQWMPVIVTILNIPLFFYFAKQVDLTAHVSVASNYAYYIVGVLTCTACAEGPDSQTNINTVKPKEYSISNFPNPFNPTTKIYFGIPYKGNVKIEVYNSTGQKIKELLNEDRDPGNYVTEFNGSDYSSGVYFYKIESGNFIQTKRMILLK